MTTGDRLQELIGDETLLRPQRRTVLRGDSAETYIALLDRLLGRSRLNRWFPDRRALQRLIRLLAPPACHFVYDDVEVGDRTGLPTERMVTRIQADRAVAPAVVAEEERRDPSLRASAIGSSDEGDDLYTRRYRYHRSLLEAPVAASFRLHATLRRVEPDGATYLTVRLDRYDLSEELFVRYVIDLRYRPAGRRRVHVDGDRVRLDEGFANEVARAALHDSEIAFLLLSEILGVEVETVARARVGPLYAAGFDVPPDLEPLVAAHPGELVLSCPTDRTSVEIADDHWADPLAIGYREFLSGPSRAIVEARREQLDYATERRRKLVATAGIVPALRDWTTSRNAPCVIYALR